MQSHSKQILMQILLLAALQTQTNSSYTYDKATKVKQLLHSRRINRNALPIPPNGSVPFTVQTHFILHDLVDVDSHQETMRLTASIVIIWEDYNLQWSSADINTSWITIGAREVWYPTFLLSNSVGERVHARPDPRFDDLTVYDSGLVILRMYYTFDTNCDSHVLKFPRDALVCKLSFVSSLESSSIKIEVDSLGTQMIAFDNNDNEWRVTSLTFKPTIENFTVLGQAYEFSAVTAEIKVIRSLGYYLVVLQMPILIINSLIVLSTFISVADGERLGFITELCLTYIVFLLLVDSVLPKSGLPILSVCSIVCFFLAVMNLVEAVVVRHWLRLAETEEETYSKSESIAKNRNDDAFTRKDQEIKVRGFSERPWILYAKRLEWFTFFVNIVVVFSLILLNICIVYS